MATNLNPGADATLVGVAYRAAMADVPGDYSKTFEKAAESYGKTMEAQSKMWGSISALGANIGSEMMANAEEFANMAAIGGGLDSEGAEFVVKELYAVKDAQRELFGIGFLQSRETKQKKAKLKLKQKELFAEIDLAAESINAGAEAVASGSFDANLNETEGEMVNAIIKSNLKDKVTDNKNIARLTRDEKTGELMYTMYNVETDPSGVAYDPPRTMSIKQFNKSIVTNVDDKGAFQKGVTTYNNSIATKGLESQDGVYDPQMKQMDLNYLDETIKTDTDLKRAFRAKIGYTNTTFYDDIQKPSALSANLYSTLLSVTGSEGVDGVPTGEVALGGVLEGVEDIDSSGGISQLELQNATNYGILSANILGLKDPEVSKAYFKEYAAKSFEESFTYGYSKKAPVPGSGGGDGGEGAVTETNPYGIPEKGLLLGDMNRYDKQKLVRQDLVTNYIDDVKSGSDFRFRDVNYSFKDNSWYENYGTESEYKFDTTQQMVDDVFQTGGKYFDGLETIQYDNPEEIVKTEAEKAEQTQLNLLKTTGNNVKLKGDDKVSRALNAQFGFDEIDGGSRYMFVPYTGAINRWWGERLGFGPMRLSSDSIWTNNIMLWDKDRDEVVKDGKTFRMKDYTYETGSDAVKGNYGLDGTSRALTNKLKELGIETSSAPLTAADYAAGKTN